MKRKIGTSNGIPVFYDTVYRFAFVFGTSIVISGLDSETAAKEVCSNSLKDFRRLQYMKKKIDLKKVGICLLLVALGIAEIIIFGNEDATAGCALIFLGLAVVFGKEE